MQPVRIHEPLPSARLRVLNVPSMLRKTTNGAKAVQKSVAYVSVEVKLSILELLSRAEYTSESVITESTSIYSSNLGYSASRRTILSALSAMYHVLQITTSFQGSLKVTVNIGLERPIVRQ